MQTKLFAGQPAPERVKIWRNSHESGRCEAAFWNLGRIGRRDCWRLVWGAKLYDRAGRGTSSPDKRGRRRRNGPIGHVGIEALEGLISFRNHATGELDPAIASICERTGRSRTAIFHALKRLAAAGILEWKRRQKRGDNGKHEQDTNAYRLVIPPAIQRLLGLRGHDAPPPDDDAHRRADAARGRDRMTVAAITTGAGVTFDSTPLGLLNATLHKLGRRLVGQSTPGDEKPKKESST